MEVREYPNAGEFLKKAEGFLLEHEAENNLILGQAARLARGDVISGGPSIFYGVEDEGKLLIAGMHTNPYRLLLTRGPAFAVAMIADYLARKKVSPAGVNGQHEQAMLFTRAWSKLSRDKIKPGHQLRIYQLEKLTMPRASSGHLEQAMPRDIDMLHEWAIAFTQDVQQPPTGSERKMVELGVKEGRMFLWKDSKPVAMAAWAGPTPNGVRINFVYTPAEFRRRGYASNLVAGLTKKLLDGGKKFCFLYTDLGNPTSNKIYQQMGYQPVCDISEYDFESGK